MVGGCVLTPDGSALLQTDFCSCPTSANKQHKFLQLACTGKEFSHWDIFYLSCPFPNLSIKPLKLVLVYQQVG